VLKIWLNSRVPVAPSCSGGRDQEDLCLKPSFCSWDPILKIRNTKIRLVEWLEWQNACLECVRPWLQTPVTAKKKN
jgi:hypothetical protein